MLKKIVYVLIGGFVAISIAVGFIPEITDISTSGLAGVTKVVVDIALWLIPLAVGFLILMMGLRVFKGFSYRRARSRGGEHYRPGKRVTKSMPRYDALGVPRGHKDYRPNLID